MNPIGATSGVFEPGHYIVRIRRTKDDPWNEQPIVVIREATRQEYIDYHEANGLRWECRPGDHYYEILTD